MKMAELYPVGEKITIGSYQFTKQRIFDFATLYDPQNFHIDEEAAKHSVLGGLCASGWQTAAVWMRTFLDFLGKEKVRIEAEGQSFPNLGPSPGFKNLRWIKPVFVDDVITYSITYIATKPLASRPGWSVVLNLNEGVNQNGELVFSFEGAVLEFA